MTLPIYTTGTVEVDHLGTVVTGTGGMWSGINAREGDYFVRADGTAVITEVTDATHLKITPWPGATVAGGNYAIEQNYVGRVVGVAAAEDVGIMLEKLHTDGLPFIVGADETVPDPSYGDEGQLAFRPTTGEWWMKTGGAWVPSAGLVALGYGGTSASSVAIGLSPPAKVFATQIDLAYNGARVRASSAANLNNWMEGPATYLGTTLTLTCDLFGGGGTHADWLFAVAGVPGQQGPAGTPGAPGTPGGAAPPSDAPPLMDGAVQPGVSASYTRADHIHPSDTSRVAKAGDTMTGLLILSADPGVALGAATKQYVDARDSILGQGGQCKLAYVSATQLILKPFNGNALKINGVLNAIPAAGVTLANTGLAASTLYYIYAWMNAGVMTLEASVTGHSPSVTAGNVGTESKNGDDTRSLVGMIYTNGLVPGQFVDAITNRYVRSWFNESGIVAMGTAGGNITVTSTTQIEIETACRAYFLRWAGEGLSGNVNCQTFANGAMSTFFTIFLMVDGGLIGNPGAGQSAVANQQLPVVTAGAMTFATDGLSWANVSGGVAGATLTAQFAAKGVTLLTVRR